MITASSFLCNHIYYTMGRQTKGINKSVFIENCSCNFLAVPFVIAQDNVKKFEVEDVL